MSYSPDAPMNTLYRPKRGPLFDQQFLAGLSGGLSGAPSGGFFGGLFQGLSGSLRGIQMYQHGTQEEERQRIRDMVEERRYQERMAIENQRLGLEQRRVAVAERPDAGAAQPDLLRISEADWPTYMSRYQSIHPKESPSEKTYASDRAIELLQWAEANPSSPRARAILTLYGNKVNPIGGTDTEYIYDQDGNIIGTKRRNVRPFAGKPQAFDWRTRQPIPDVDVDKLRGGAVTPTPGGLERFAR